MLGYKQIKPTKDEILKRETSRRAAFARLEIKKGSIIEKKMLIFKRPSEKSKGISALNYKEILGKKTKKNILKDQVIRNSDIEKK